MKKPAPPGHAKPSHRTARIEREIREVVGNYLISGFRGELPGIVTVSRVAVSPDLRQAKIYFTLLAIETAKSQSETSLPGKAPLGKSESEPGDEEVLLGAGKKARAKKISIQQKAEAALGKHAHEIQIELASRLEMRFTPQLRFYYDEGFENALKVEKILRDLEAGRAKSDGESSES